MAEGTLPGAEPVAAVLCLAGLVPGGHGVKVIAE